MNDIIVALISAGSALGVGALTFLGVVITNRKANNDLIHKMAVQQAVTDTKIEELTREVREHNNFAKRMPVVETKIEHILDDEKEIHKEINHLKSFHEER